MWLEKGCAFNSCKNDEHSFFISFSNYFRELSPLSLRKVYFNILYMNADFFILANL